MDAASDCAQDLTEENSTILLGSKANQGMIDARLLRAPTRLPTVSYYAEHMQADQLSAVDDAPYGADSDTEALRYNPELEQAVRVLWAVTQLHEPKF